MHEIFMYKDVFVKHHDPTTVHRGYLFHSVKDGNLFHRVVTDENSFKHGCFLI